LFVESFSVRNKAILQTPAQLFGINQFKRAVEIYSRLDKALDLLQFFGNKN
jgi:hypothetical protein